MPTLAMYAAKKSGKGRISYCSGEMKAAVQEKMMLTNRLHRALENQELFLHYQPQVSAKTHEITGFEALLRWNHPERGIISAGACLFPWLNKVETDQYHWRMGVADRLCPE